MKRVLLNNRSVLTTTLCRPINTNTNTTTTTALLHTPTPTTIPTNSNYNNNNTFSSSSLSLLLSKPIHTTTIPHIGVCNNNYNNNGCWFSSAGATSASEYCYCPKDVVLYQYQACPFCNKLRAFLDYNDIPYKVVEVNPMSKKEIKWSEYKKVPILMVDGEQMTDSSDIIKKLFRKMHPEISSDAASAKEEEKWFGWVDNHLVHVLSPNIYRTAGEALESFDYITTHGNFSLTERIFAKYAGAAAMYFVSKKLKKRHNITDARKSLYDAAETWVDALQGRNFLGDLKPNLADLAVFGVLRPIRHLKSGRDMVENTCIGDWYKRMESAVGESSKIIA